MPSSPRKKKASVGGVVKKDELLNGLCPDCYKNELQKKGEE